ncbi:MAG: metalloregulator ArsR/SmtB family transcription factor [Magnetospirillum sp.]|nr:metalloregulator ArsR/SmtB family transcription factor [Magnetospirillum sp.]
MTTIGLDEGIEALRRARLAPTPQRVTVAGLVFSGPTLALTASELQDRAVDADMYLSRDEAEGALAELRAAGVLPLMFESRGGGFDLGRAARLLQAMGNPHRLRVLRELLGGERCAGDLGRMTGLQPSALSQHLSRLRADGLVRCRRAGSRIYYALAGEAAKSVLRSLAV